MNGVKKWYKIAFNNLPTGTISRKYECSPDEFTFGANDTYGEGPMNIRLIRYADIILMAAEAAYEEGDNGKALDYVNLVRQRARNSGETGYPESLSVLSFEDIVHERRLELAMETSRYFDLVRWNLAEKFINGITLASMGDGLEVNFIKGKHEFFPIPQRELQKAPGLVQYPGW
ncbi:MAG: RagB/SusD family nutrient uptake outer membrane protein, partial [Salinivirgaceae bacterium]|nr:RagB/SusD family nutrient uptake outer membrane protein [Salinivirgaceae bacterium]